MKKNPKPEIGGMVALQYFIAQQRNKYPTSLVLDAGYVLTGTPISKIKVHDVYGGGFVDMINLIGYKAFTIGNHELDEGQENLKKLTQLFNCDVLSANLFKDGQLFADKSYAIYDFDKIWPCFANFPVLQIRIMSVGQQFPVL